METPPAGTNFAFVTQSEETVNGIPTLNSAMVVEQVVRDMLSQVLESARAVSAGEMPPDAGVHAVVQETQHVADIFAGHSEEFAATIPWFSAMQLGTYLKERFGILTPVEDAIHTYLLECSRVAVEIARRASTGYYETAFGLRRMDMLIESMKEALLGMTPAVPVPQPEVVFDLTAGRG